jgi:uncharacterized UPF0146 family protein
MQIHYETWCGENPFLRFARAVRGVAASPGCSRVCEIGAGANPLFSLADTEAMGITEYVLVDISETELAKAPSGYTKVVADITAGPLPGVGGFDLVLSQTVAEHVRDGERFHRAVIEMLGSDARAMHFFPTLYEPAFILNRLLPDALTVGVIERSQEHRSQDGAYGKFPAYYRWCRGPTRRQLARFASIGYEIEEYVGLFGHSYYRPVPPIDRLEDALSRFCVRHPWPLLTSYAWVTLRKP